MKEDYLWDKTGTDPEVERLESLLSGLGFSEAFRAKSNVIHFPLRNRSNYRPWIFALAACVTLVAGIGLGNLISTGREATPVQTAISFDEVTETDTPPISPANVENAQTNVPPAAHKPAEIRKAKSRVAHRRANFAHHRKENAAVPLLTAEEKYAYGQLMLALSITSSKWQEAQDSINGSERTQRTDK